MRQHVRRLKFRFFQPRAWRTNLVFWGGGVDTQHVLPKATPDEVRREVRKNAEILMKDGGFVFTQVHNIQAGVPPENVLAMNNVILKYGWYN